MEATKYLKLSTGPIVQQCRKGSVGVWGVGCRGGEGCLPLLSGIPKAGHMLKTDVLKTLGLSWSSSYRAQFPQPGRQPSSPSPFYGALTVSISFLWCPRVLHSTSVVSMLNGLHAWKASSLSQWPQLLPPEPRWDPAATSMSFPERLF